MVEVSLYNELEHVGLVDKNHTLRTRTGYTSTSPCTGRSACKQSPWPTARARDGAQGTNRDPTLQARHVHRVALWTLPTRRNSWFR